MTSNEHQAAQSTAEQDNYDVVVIGAGLAGLSLSRHLQLVSNKRVLLLEKRAEIPPPRQKVGESLVQVGGYYFAKVLDMEEHLLREHFMKYNLRFYFANQHRDNDRFEDFGQAYIRNFSNIPCYQLDRNRIEEELLELNLGDEHFQLVAPAADVQVQLAEDGPHQIQFNQEGKDRAVAATWVVDTTGRGQLLARQMELRESNVIDHGAAFMWVDGLVDIEKLTDATPREIRLNKDRRATGHLPHWLATNHFMGEGYWFWVIPLQGKTSLGLVYDNALFARDQVASAEKLRDWACRQFPLLARDLPERNIIDFSALKDFAYGCKETINPARWAMSGESGRFTDPLYSPGSDFIALHNSLIVEAILTDDPRELKRKCWLYEMVMQSMYGSLLPTYAKSYDALGDQETFVLKYTWELSVYFTFFVFPFINDLAANVDFVPAYLSRFSRLGVLNGKLQAFISAYYQWKKANCPSAETPVFHDFTRLEPLRRAERTFYEVGVSAAEAKEVLDDQLVNLKELARFMVAHVYSVVLANDRVVTNRAFIDSIDFNSLTFAPEQMRAEWAVHADSSERYDWQLDPTALQSFATARDVQANAPELAKMT